MTWSILARDPSTGSFVVGITTCAFAVGASCPYVRAGVGAVSTQSMTNRYLGPAVLDGMARGLHPVDAIQGALAGDEGRGIRQVHALDRHGRTAAWTGANCVEWCGDAAERDVSVAGNMLAGESVVTDTMACYLANDSLPLPERILAALEGGEAAGGDRRGRQSAAMKLVSTEDFPDLDLRVDDHLEPLSELRRLLLVWRRERAPGLLASPRKDNPSGFTDLGAIEEGWKARGMPLRFRR